MHAFIYSIAKCVVIASIKFQRSVNGCIQSLVIELPLNLKVQHYNSSLRLNQGTFWFDNKNTMAYAGHSDLLDLISDFRNITGYTLLTKSIMDTCVDLNRIICSAPCMPIQLTSDTKAAKMD